MIETRTTGHCAGVSALANGSFHLAVVIRGFSVWICKQRNRCTKLPRQFFLGSTKFPNHLRCRQVRQYSVGHCMRPEFNTSPVHLADLVPVQHPCVRTVRKHWAQFGFDIADESRSSIAIESFCSEERRFKTSLP